MMLVMVNYSFFLYQFSQQKNDEELLQRDNLHCAHHRNIQRLATELYEIQNNFPSNSNSEQNISS